MTKQPILEIAVLIASVLGILFMVSTVFAHGTVACTTITSSLSVGADDGAKAGNVTALQAFLHAEDLLAVEPNGHFGPLTQKAVKAFQSSQKLEAVGSVGPLTRAAIKSVSCAQTTPVPTPVVPVHPVPTPTIPVAPAPTPVAPTSTPAAAAVSLPYLAPSFNGWVSTWGTVEKLDGGSLLIKASTTTTGAEAIFPASKAWADYRVTANVLSTNSDIVMIARYVDADNFLMCTFTNNWVTIKQRLHGTTTTMTEGAVQGMSGSLSAVRSTTVAMRVQGKSVGCSEMGPDDNLTFNNVDPSLLKGGIGFDTWNQNINFASVQVYSVSASAL